MHDIIRRERRATMAARNQYVPRLVPTSAYMTGFGLLTRDLAPFSALHYPPRGIGGASQAAPTSFERGTAMNASRSDNSPPRSAWPQTGERRSPPSEASENSRRTRPRHGDPSVSIPAGVPTNPPIPGSAQARERVIYPVNPPRFHQDIPEISGNHPLTRLYPWEQQPSDAPSVMPGLGNNLHIPARPFEYLPPGSLGPIHPVAQNQRAAVANAHPQHFFSSPFANLATPTAPTASSQPYDHRRDHAQAPPSWAPVVNGSTRASPRAPSVVEPNVSA